MGRMVSGFLEGPSNIVRSVSFTAYAVTTGSSEIDRLRQQIASLQSQLIASKQQQKEINALRDQFATEKLEFSKLLPAKVVGMKSFLPGYSLPEQFVIDKGASDGLAKGMTVVYENVLIGQISEVREHVSLVDLSFHKRFSVTAITSETQALGVVKGQGNGEFLLDNVVLSDELKKNDIVLTKGSVDIDGVGVISDLQIGKIISIEKKPSSLFQTAKLSRLVDIPRLTTVFVHR